MKLCVFICLSFFLLSVVCDANNVFVIDSNQVVTSSIKPGHSIEHFRSYLVIKKDGSADEIIDYESKNPFFYLNKNIDEIQILSGAERVILPNSHPLVNRLILYLSEGLDQVRKKMNKPNEFGIYTFNPPHEEFDCFRFAYFLQKNGESKDFYYSHYSQGDPWRLGKEISSKLNENLTRDSTAPSNVLELSKTYIGVYEMYSQFNRYSLQLGNSKFHYFVHLGKGVYVSKCGKRLGVFFSSFSTLLKDYWPENFPFCNLNVYFD